MEATMCDWCGRYAPHYDNTNTKDHYQLPKDWKNLGRFSINNLSGWSVYKNWCGRCDPRSPLLFKSDIKEKI